MRRREFIALTGGAALGWPISARAQQGERMRRVGVLMGYSAGFTEAGPFLTEFKKALTELGWIEGRNIQIDYRWASTDADSMRVFAKELIDLKPDVIVGHSTPVMAALHRETSTIPIVFVTVSDPVGSRFVASLARPGGNITGFINLESSLGGKWIEILKEVAPGIARVGLLFNPQTAPHFDYYQQAFEAAARSARGRAVRGCRSLRRGHRTARGWHGWRAECRHRRDARYLYVGAKGLDHIGRGTSSCADGFSLSIHGRCRRSNLLWDRH